MINIQYDVVYHCCATPSLLESFQHVRDIHYLD